MPEISVVVPCYNVGQFVGECLESLLAQTHTDWQAICVDDGSTDNTLTVLEDFARRDPRIEVISQPNAGLSAARNRGIEGAAGEFLMFVDSDDWLDPATMERARSFHHDLVCFSYNRIFTSDVAPRHLGLHGSFPQRYIQRRMVGLIGQELRDPTQLNVLVTAHSKMMRRELLESPPLRFVDTALIGVEDVLFSIQLLNRVSNDVLVLDEPLYQYRRHNETSLTSVYRPKLVDQFRTLHDEIAKSIDRCDQEFEEALQNRIALSIIGYGLNESVNPAGPIRRAANLNRILQRPDVSSALSQLPLSPLPALRRIFFLLARWRVGLGVWLLSATIRTLMNRRNTERVQGGGH